MNCLGIEHSPMSESFEWHEASPRPCGRDGNPVQERHTAIRAIVHDQAWHPKAAGGAISLAATHGTNRSLNSSDRAGNPRFRETNVLAEQIHEVASVIRRRDQHGTSR